MEEDTISDKCSQNEFQSERNRPTPILLKFESDITFKKQFTPKQSPKKSLEQEED